jgi:hypothetical protein
VVGFAEEEGQRYKATFLGSGALTGDFDPAWLEQTDADGVTHAPGDGAAGLPASGRHPKLRRDPARYLGFVEVHIEQGPVLERAGPAAGRGDLDQRQRALPGRARSAWPATPAPRRWTARDAAAAWPSWCCSCRAARRAVPDLVGTVGMLDVPSGSINVVPGRCRFSLDIRATTDAVRDACAADVLAGSGAHLRAARRDLHARETMRAPPHPAHRRWQARWEQAVRGARPAGAPHAQRRRTRRDEAARGDAAGHAVRARRERRHQPQPAGVDHQPRHATCVRRPSSLLLDPTRRRQAMSTPIRLPRLDAWIDAHFDEQVRFLQELVRCPPTRRRATTPRMRERTASCWPALRLRRRAHAVPGRRAGAWPASSPT